MRILSVPGGPDSGSAGARREAPDWGQRAKRATGRRKEEPFCAESSTCFRLGTDADGNACTAVAGQARAYLTGTREALSTLLRDTEAGKADHLVQCSLLSLPTGSPSRREPLLRDPEIAWKETPRPGRVGG